MKLNRGNNSLLGIMILRSVSDDDVSLSFIFLRLSWNNYNIWSVVDDIGAHFVEVAV